MERRVTGIYFIMLLIGMIYAVFAAFSFRNTVDARRADNKAVMWDEQMEMTQEDGAYYYRRILPVEGTNEKVIVYNTVHMYLQVFIDGKEVYALRAEKGRAVKTTGSCWNIISLTEEDAGKEIVFQVAPVYRGGKPNGSFYYGTYREIEHKIFKERLVRLGLAVLIALAGAVMLLYGIFVVKKGQETETIVQFAVFALMLGIWSLIETQIPDWILPCNMMIVFLSHLLLMIMPIPFILFLRKMYHNGENRLWGFCCYADCVAITVRVVLQIMGLYDLRETLVLTHIYLVLFVAVLVIMTIQEIAANEFTGLTRINGVCVLIILAGTLLELLAYRFGNVSIPFGSIGFSIYIIVMGIVNVRRSRELIEQARENAIYRKLAFTDELTGLANRTAFREDLDKRMESDQATGEAKILPTVVFMFDLNDLKKCNDTFGHDYGDQYIKMAADALKKIFAKEGRCYRIGGDEFCAWEPYISADKIDEKLRTLEREIQVYNDRGFVVDVSISVGYAIYQEGVDGGGLYSTMKRADAMMYERKQAYKKGRDKNDPARSINHESPAQ